jgi:hypothetical protein
MMMTLRKEQPMSQLPSELGLMMKKKKSQLSLMRKLRKKLELRCAKNSCFLIASIRNSKVTNLS